MKRKTSVKLKDDRYLLNIRTHYSLLPTYIHNILSYAGHDIIMVYIVHCLSCLNNTLVNIRTKFVYMAIT